MAPVLFEVSWEVCNKVGGIYTVLRSKAPFIQSHYDEYIVIGPSIAAQTEFEERPCPLQWQNVFGALKDKGITCRFGVWLIPGRPTAILVDAAGLVQRKDELKFFYWDRFHVDSMHASWEFEEPMCFATAAGMLVEEFARHCEKKVIAQCHEWIAGFALLHLKGANAPVGTVFTTHATMLGRTIAGNGNQLYDMLDTINPAEWAYKYNVQDKHLTEVACAQNADVFTTVSEITGMEAQRLLGRKPDVLLYNGFHSDKFSSFEETSIRHYQSREQLHEFIAYHFFPYYSIDLQKTLLYFTSGRYEFQNKGMDVLIEALGRLNGKLKADNSERTIVMFFWVIMGRGRIRADVLENKNMYNELKSAVEWQTRPLIHKIILDFLCGHTPGENDLFTSSFIRAMQEDVRHIRREGEPPLSTHEIDQNDALLRCCQDQGLHNRKDDRVKVIIFPGYLDGSDGIINLPYYDATVGAHLGIFPSSYEPWGYTPLESAVTGVPAVTTDLAGFGRYVLAANYAKGISVLRRQNRSREDIIADLAQQLHTYALLEHDERVQQGFAAKTAANLCDWKHFVGHYFTAHELALRNR
jgi:glycogen synthase